VASESEERNFGNLADDADEPEFSPANGGKQAGGQAKRASRLPFPFILTDLKLEGLS
jgi:hypothetical protein